MNEFKTGYTCPNCGNHYNNALSSNQHKCLLSKGKKILDSLPRIESDPKDDLMKLKKIHEVMRKHKEETKIRKKKQQ